MKRVLEYLTGYKRETSDGLSCPITHCLMVEPVVAPDGNTYERSAILEWMKIRKTSPLNPSLLLSPTNLVRNRNLESVIERAVEQGDVTDDAANEWREKRGQVRSALELYKDGQILEAAAKGLPVAQGELAKKAFEVRDYETSMHWAKLAADVFEPIGTFYLAYAYYTGKGMPTDWEKAFTYFARVHDRVPCAKYICRMYKEGGFGVEKNDRELYMWSKRGQFEHADNGLQLGVCYYEGVGVEQNHVNARNVWSRCSHPEAMFRYGKMLMKGEGGETNRLGGMQCLEQAAKQGFADALTYLRVVSDI
jgi:TPR repeat protein